MIKILHGLYIIITSAVFLALAGLTFSSFGATLVTWSFLGGLVYLGWLIKNDAQRLTNEIENENALTEILKGNRSLTRSVIEQIQNRRGENFSHSENQALPGILSMCETLQRYVSTLIEKSHPQVLLDEIGGRYIAGEPIVSGDLNAALQQHSEERLEQIWRYYEAALAVGFIGTLVGIVIQVVIAQSAGINGIFNSGFLNGGLLAVTTTLQGVFTAVYARWLRAKLQDEFEIMSMSLIDSARHHFIPVLGDEKAREMLDITNFADWDIKYDDKSLFFKQLPDKVKVEWYKEANNRQKLPYPMSDSNQLSYYNDDLVELAINLADTVFEKLGDWYQQTTTVHRLEKVLGAGLEGFLRLLYLKNLSSILLQSKLISNIADNILRFHNNEFLLQQPQYFLDKTLYKFTTSNVKNIRCDMIGELAAHLLKNKSVVENFILQLPQLGYSEAMISILNSLRSKLPNKSLEQAFADCQIEFLQASLQQYRRKFYYNPKRWDITLPRYEEWIEQLRIHKKREFGWWEQLRSPSAKDLQDDRSYRRFHWNLIDKLSQLSLEEALVMGTSYFTTFSDEALAETLVERFLNGKWKNEYSGLASWLQQNHVTITDNFETVSARMIFTQFVKIAYSHYRLGTVEVEIDHLIGTISLLNNDKIIINDLNNWFNKLGVSSKILKRYLK